LSLINCYILYVCFLCVARTVLTPVRSKGTHSIETIKACTISRSNIQYPVGVNSADIDHMCNLENVLLMNDERGPINDDELNNISKQINFLNHILNIKHPLSDHMKLEKSLPKGYIIPYMGILCTGILKSNPHAISFKSDVVDIINDAETEYNFQVKPCIFFALMHRKLLKDALLWYSEIAGSLYDLHEEHRVQAFWSRYNKKYASLKRNSIAINQSNMIYAKDVEEAVYYFIPLSNNHYRSWFNKIMQEIVGLLDDGKHR
jgi:hypothetical protein